MTLVNEALNKSENAEERLPTLQQNSEETSLFKMIINQQLEDQASDNSFFNVSNLALPLTFNFATSVQTPKRVMRGLDARLYSLLRPEQITLLERFEQTKSLTHSAFERAELIKLKTFLKTGRLADFSGLADTSGHKLERLRSASDSYGFSTEFKNLA